MVFYLDIYLLVYFFSIMHTTHSGHSIYPFNIEMLSQINEIICYYLQILASATVQMS